MIYGSVCSGIEAASVAWRPLGWRAAFLSEIAKFPRAVLAQRHGGVPLHGDFTTIESGRYEAIDILVGGTPCQDFSVAGLRAGITGDRGNLTLEFVRLAQRLRPTWLVWENVPGIFSLDDGRAFGAFLGGLAELGYGFAYRVLDAQYAGLAQRRERVFVVGHRGDWRRAAAVLFESESLRWNPPPSREAGKTVAPTIASRPTGGGGLGTDHANAGGQLGIAAFHENQRAEVTTNNDTAGSLKVRGGKPGQGYPALISGAAVRRLTPRECERLQGFPDDYTLIEYRGKPAADGPRYKALGNSMAVPVMRWLGERIQLVETMV